MAVLRQYVKKCGRCLIYSNNFLPKPINMNEQNFKNHTRYVPLHLAGYVLAAIILGGSIVKFSRSYSTGLGGLLVPALLVLISLLLIILLWYCRWFALRAQDRAIRAEENLRHFALTGKLLNPQLRMSQIVALRFAPDAEFISLAEKAVAENLSSKKIKTSIVNWKADHNRV